MSKVIYELKRWHHERYYRKGDLESRDVQDFSETFSTRKAANECLIKNATDARRRGWTANLELVKRGNEPSRLTVYTGDKWVHENTGDDEEEHYWYNVTKKTL